MPYTRKGKCVYKKTGKKVGCSKTASKAKEYLKALHANTANERYTFEDLVTRALLEKAKQKKVSKTRAKCQSKAKQKYDTWPSAYASGYVQKCVKRGGKIK
jgi:hypothetical protein